MTFSFLQAASDSADLDTYTFASQNLGTADSNRYIIVSLSARATTTTAFTVSSVSVGGVTGTIVQQYSNVITNVCLSAIAIVAVPSGTTGDVVVTLSRTALRCCIALYGAVGINPTATDSGTSGDANPTYAIDIAADGVAIGVVGRASGAADTATWTNITEDYDSVIDTTFNFTGASAAFVEQQTNLDLTATLAGIATEPAGVFASFAPASTVLSGGSFLSFFT